MTKLPKKRTTKKEQLIKLLSGKSGCEIKSLSAKLGWQHHTTRAALSDLRKAGCEVSRERPASGGVSKYRIVSAPAQQAAAASADAHGA